MHMLSEEQVWAKSNAFSHFDHPVVVIEALGVKVITSLEQAIIQIFGNAILSQIGY